MTDAARRPSGLTTAEVHAHRVRAFVGERCALHPTLVVPLGIVWREYRLWCLEARVDASARGLRRTLEAVSWCEVEERPARGRFRTVVRGLGVLPKEGEGHNGRGY